MCHDLDVDENADGHGGGHGNGRILKGDDDFRTERLPSTLIKTIKKFQQVYVLLRKMVV